MRIWKITLVGVVIVSLLCILGCGREEEPQTSGDDESKSGSSAVSAGKIDTGDDDADEIIIKPDTQPGDTDDGGQGGVELPEIGPRDPAEPIQGSIKMDDLVYPVTDLRTGERIKEKIGDVTSHVATTSDPFPDVWFYYSQILAGRDVESKNNIHDAGKASLHATFNVKDGGNRYVVDLGEASPGGMTIIMLSKN